MNKISLYGIVEDTTVDGPGFRTALYAAGCHHFCPGCHNPDSWNIENGKVYRLDYLLDVIQNARFANVTFSGGEPLMQVDAFTELARRIKQQTNKNIWCYTGYLFENIYKDKKINKILPYIDVLVDGPFIEK